LRIDIVAAGDDEVLATPDDGDIAPGVDLADIAGDQVAVGPEFRPGLFRHAPVALEHIGAADLDHADLFHRELLAGLGIDDAQRHPRQRETDRAGDTLAVIGVRGQHVGLGHAVALEDPEAGLALELAV